MSIDQPTQKKSATHPSPAETTHKLIVRVNIFSEVHGCGFLKGFENKQEWSLAIEQIQRAVQASMGSEGDCPLFQLSTQNSGGFCNAEIVILFPKTLQTDAIHVADEIRAAFRRPFLQ